MQMRPPHPASTTYAGSSTVGVTMWERKGSDAQVEFTLYRSPDAAHFVEAMMEGDTLRGTGRTWGVLAASVNFPPDTVIAVKVGPPDISPCVEASTSEWRRLRALRQSR